jgi:hypothetical protein
MNPSVLMGLVPCFSKLVSLNLRMTLTVDQVNRIKCDIKVNRSYKWEEPAV